MPAARAQRAGPERSRRPPLILWLLGPALLFLLAGSLAGLRLNLTQSLPLGLYVASRVAPGRGSLVLACLPNAVAVFAKERGYVPRGGVCPGGLVPVGKEVLAVFGDTVDLSAAGLRVNGVPVRNGAPLVTDRAGRPLPRLAPGSYVLSAGQLWLGSSHSRWSFDSRYFGALETRQVLATVRALWTAR